MIEFRGYLHYTARRYLLKKMQKITTIGAICMFFLLGVPSLLAWIYWGIWVFFAMSLLGTIWMFALTWMVRRDAYPSRIIIDIKEKKIFGEYRKGAGDRSIDDVKKVIDMGEFYDIIFYFPNQWSNCICQKDLIIKGTIEEFEEFFKDKIVRKHKTKD
ncbi:MAG: hypothetical protein IJF64_03745 [Clostridia bacterium]|nr:hypothetical protein [Clostridia bacterium]